MSDLENTIDLNQFEISKYIDQGGFGQVFEVLEKSTGNKYAAKISKETVDPMSKDTTLNLLREVNINASINHPSILQFIGFSFKDFQNDDKPVIITELAHNGSLSKVLDYESKGLSIPGWDSTKKLINLYGIASGMSFLHSKNLLHRDLKLENILCDDRLFPKLSDFGLSKKYYSDGFASTTQSILNLKGTPAYFSPEIIEFCSYTPAGDVYAFGIVAYEILTGERAFSGLTISQLFATILNGKRPTIPNYVSEEYKQLIERCWSQKSEDRPTFDEIVEELKSDKFITAEIDEEDYRDYIDFIDEYRKTYDKDKKIIKLEDIIANYNKKTFQKVSISTFKSQIETQKILPPSIYSELSETCQKQVDESGNDPEKKFYVGKNLIEGKKGFPVDVEHGMKYLEYSNESGCVDAALYLSEMYIKGELIEENTTKAKKYLLKYEYSNDSRVYNLLGILIKNENNHKEARKFFERGTKLHNPESMFNYSKMLLRGEGGKKEIHEAMNYLNMSSKHGYNKSSKYLSFYDEMKSKNPFSNFSEEVQHFFAIQLFDYNENKNLDEMNMKFEIQLTSSDTENFFNDKVLSNPDFINTLKSFSKVSVNVDYQPESFKLIFQQIEEMKSIFINDINVYVVISNCLTSIGESAFSKCSSLTQITFEIPSSLTSIGDNAFRGCSSLKQITIPSPVTSIGDCTFAGCSSLTQITIPSSVTSIGNYAFSKCSSLKQITIPSSVTSIGNYAFSWCSSLTQITIPSSVTSIEYYAFRECSSLTQITFEIPSSLTSIGNYAFSGCSSLTKISIPSSVNSIGYYAFEGCSSLTQITIPSSVTSIGNKSFSRCSSLTQILIPSSVTLIGDSVFEGCSSLTQITFEIPSSVTSIGNSAFYGCSSLTQISIPSSVNSIGNSAFEECSSLTQITIPSSVTSIGNKSFSRCSSLTQISIPSSVTLIGDSAFSGCLSLTQITFEIPSSLTSIKEYAFHKCSSLVKITIPSSVTSIVDYSFSGCSSLTQISIPSSVTSIGYYAFEKCSSLAQITFEIPSSLTSIGEYTFSQCTSLAKITIPSSVTSIGNNPFSGCSSLTQITIPSSVTSIGKNAFSGCSSLTQITMPSSVTSIGNNPFSGCSSLLQITIPSSVTSIGNYAFYGCSSLMQITFEIPSSVTSIGNNAFSWCSSLTQITIPSSVTTIGNYAFRECSSLIQITIPSSVTSIGNNAFSWCLSLTQITFEIPSSVTTIGEYAFSRCTSLTQITIPSSVTAIKDFAFSECTSLIPFQIPSSVVSVGNDIFKGCSNSSCNIQ